MAECVCPSVGPLHTRAEDRLGVREMGTAWDWMYWNRQRGAERCCEHGEGVELSGGWNEEGFVAEVAVTDP